MKVVRSHLFELLLFSLALAEDDSVGLKDATEVWDLNEVSVRCQYASNKLLQILSILSQH